MNPWTIIGWVVVVLGGLFGLLVSWFVGETILIPWLWANWHHLRTRRTPPRPYQKWIQGKDTLTILPNNRNDRIVMTTKTVIGRREYGNGATWSDSPEDWKERVKGRRLWLLSEPDPDEET